MVEDQPVQGHGQRHQTASSLLLERLEGCLGLSRRASYHLYVFCKASLPLTFSFLLATRARAVELFPLILHGLPVQDWGTIHFHPPTLSLRCVRVFVIPAIQHPTPPLSAIMTVRTVSSQPLPFLSICSRRQRVATVSMKFCLPRCSVRWSSPCSPASPWSSWVLPVIGTRGRSSIESHSPD